jgi:hypothetical protein
MERRTYCQVHLSTGSDGQGTVICDVMVVKAFRHRVSHTMSILFRVCMLRSDGLELRQVPSSEMLHHNLPTRFRSTTKYHSLCYSESFGNGCPARHTHNHSSTGPPLAWQFSILTQIIIFTRRLLRFHPTRSRNCAMQ